MKYKIDIDEWFDMIEFNLVDVYDVSYLWCIIVVKEVV